MMGLDVAGVIIEGGDMPVLTFNECDYSCEGKHGGRGFRVYCRKVDRKCGRVRRVKESRKAVGKQIAVKTDYKTFYHELVWLGGEEFLFVRSVWKNGHLTIEDEKSLSKSEALQVMKSMKVLVIDELLKRAGLL